MAAIISRISTDKNDDDGSAVIRVAKRLFNEHLLMASVKKSEDKIYKFKWIYNLFVSWEVFIFTHK